MLFSSVWMILTTITYGCQVPAGLFLPAIIVGCSLGAVYSDIVTFLWPNNIGLTDESFVLVGAAALLAG